MELYENGCYTADLYDTVGLTEDVRGFLHYNANKALMNLGYDPLFPKDACVFDAAILASLDLTGENHDFFSGSGSSYIMAVSEATTDDDWS